MVVSIDVKLSTQLEVQGETRIVIIRNHNQLANLEYENSGHSGFASSQDIENLKREKASNVKVHVESLESDEIGYLEALVRLFSDKSIPCIPGTFYTVYAMVGRTDTEYKTFHLNDLAKYLSFSSSIEKYIVESKEAIYEVSANTNFEEENVVTWQVYKLKDKVYNDSSILNTKADVEQVKNLETQLELYTYTRSQIVADYLEEYSRFIGQTVVAMNYTDYNRRTYEFLNANIGKWGWLKQWLISCRTEYETNSARLELLLNGDETFWAYEMWAFINCESRDEYPGATDYKVEKYANGWKPATTLEKLQDDINLINIKVPTPPTATGTYVLEVVVDVNGKPSYSWKIQ